VTSGLIFQNRVTFGDDYISCSPLPLPFQSSSSTSVQPAVRPAGCIRRIALMQLQKILYTTFHKHILLFYTYYFPYKETNQIMSFEFGLWWYPADSVSCMLLHHLRRLISSWLYDRTNQKLFKRTSAITVASMKIMDNFYYEWKPSHATKLTLFVVSKRWMGHKGGHWLVHEECIAWMAVHQKAPFRLKRHQTAKQSSSYPWPLLNYTCLKVSGS